MSIATDMIGSGPVALEPRAFSALLELCEAPRAIDNAQAIAAAGARAGLPAPASPVRLEALGGVSVLDVEGVLVERRSWLSDLLGASAVGEVLAAVEDAYRDPGTHAVLLRLDSPGGTVRGIPEIHEAIMRGRESKPTMAVTHGTLGSAAYWIASAADAIAVGSPVAMVGSIGIVARHVDVSGAEAQRGIRTTEIVAGKYKRIASAFAPLSAEGRDTLQDQADYLYAAFVDAVAAGRRTTPSAVLDGYADGRVFVGKQAIAAGAADLMASSARVLADLQKGK